VPASSSSSINPFSTNSFSPPESTPDWLKVQMELSKAQNSELSPPTPPANEQFMEEEHLEEEFLNFEGELHAEETLENIQFPPINVKSEYCNKVEKKVSILSVQTP
jgi:hypothetical protein